MAASQGRSQSKRDDPDRLANFLRIWDGGSRDTRCVLLKRFVITHEHKTGAEIEAYCGFAASLVFSRVSSWFRVSLKSGGLIDMLNCISLFVCAAAGTEFVTEFVESGTCAAVLDMLVLDLETITGLERQTGMRILRAVAQSGRPYKASICALEGVQKIVHAMFAESNTTTSEMGRDLIIELGTGNPDWFKSVAKDAAMGLSHHANPTAQTALAQAVHRLIASTPAALCLLPPTLANKAASRLPSGPDETPAGPPAGSELADLHKFLAQQSVCMVESAHLGAAFEASGLVAFLLHTPSIRPYVLQLVVKLLRNTNAAQSAAIEEQAAHGRHKYHNSGHAPQLNALQVIRNCLHTADPTPFAQDLVREKVTLGLCGALLNTACLDSQCSAATTLRIICNFSETAMTEAQHILGQTLLDAVLTKEPGHVVVALEAPVNAVRVYQALVKAGWIVERTPTASPRALRSFRYTAKLPDIASPGGPASPRGATIDAPYQPYQPYNASKKRGRVRRELKRLQVSSTSSAPPPGLLSPIAAKIYSSGVTEGGVGPCMRLLRQYDAETPREGTESEDFIDHLRPAPPPRRYSDFMDPATKTPR